MLTPFLILSLALLSPSLSSARKFSHERSVGYQVQKQIDDGLGKFGIDLHRNVMKQSLIAGENTLISPISVYFSLAMAHLGTAGETRDEINHAMGLPVDEELALRSHQVLGEMYRRLQHSEYSNVSLYNGLFLQNGNTLKDTYQELVRKYYDSYVTHVDFTRGNEATNAINSWFRMKTGGKIKNYYSQTISQDIKLLLANAITFRGTWDRQFPQEYTRTETFRSEDGHDEQVSMLHKTDFLPYFKHTEDKYEVVGLPLRNGEYYVYIVLPNESVTLADMVASINYESVLQITSRSIRQTVDIKVPRLSVKTNGQIKDMLQIMGVHKLFEIPDLGNMLTETKLKVAEIHHNAEWNMDESGVDADAGTTQEYKIYDEFIPNDDVKEFHVQRPFMFFIHHPYTKTVLYYGSVHKIWQ